MERVTLHGVGIARVAIVIHNVLVRVAQHIGAILALLELSSLGHTLFNKLVVKVCTRRNFNFSE